MLQCVQAGTGEQIQPVALGETASIGRDSSSALVLGWDGISRKHFKIERFEKQNSCAWRLTCLCDVKKGNGTFVNFKRTQQCFLKHGDVIALGRGQEVEQGSSIKKSACLYQFVFLIPQKGERFDHPTLTTTSRAQVPAQNLEEETANEVRCRPSSAQITHQHQPSTLQTKASTVRKLQQELGSERQTRSSGRSEPRKEQGLLISELGLVGCGRNGRGARKGPAVRGGRLQDLALAGGSSTFGFVSEQLAEQQEARDKAWTSALVQHRSALLRQAEADRRHKAEEKAELFLIRQLEAEKMVGERRWLERRAKGV